MNRLIIFIAFLLIFSTCNKTPQIIYSEKSNAQAQSKPSKINITIETCDSTIIMLATLLDPIEGYPMLENKLIKERMVRVRIPGIDFSGDEGAEDFLWDLNCLIGMSSIEVFNLFSPQKNLNDFIKIDKIFQERKEYWLLSVHGAGRGFSIKIYDSEVISVAKNQVIYSH